jgi:hypothetical protein
MATTDRTRECYGAELFFFLLCPIIVLYRSLEAIAVCVISRRPGAASAVFSHSVKIGEAFWPALICFAHPVEAGVRR